MSNNRIYKENKRIKEQLQIAQNELSVIKSSRGYKSLRLVGHAKNQMRKSPVDFSKKVVKKILKGDLKSTGYISSNLSSIESLQRQYEEWISFNEPDQAELEHQKKIVDTFMKKPLISIVTPVFDPPIDVFKELIESCLGQTYPYFELCLGNFGKNQQIQELIDEYCEKDLRIKTWKFANKGIAGNSNTILRKCNGDYIALLDHDDTISPDALFENVKLLNEKDYDFIYSDKDKIDEAGNRFEPFFKPDWSPEIMLNANYLTHLNLMRKSIVDKVGGWDSDTDGAQDWDVFLKVVEQSKLIGHISKVLYHWRVISTSTAMSIETKPYALLGQRNAVDAYLKRAGIKAESYHSGAELLIKWQEQPNGQSIIFYRSSSPANYIKHYSSLKKLIDGKEITNSKWIVLHDFEVPKHEAGSANLKYVKYDEGALSTAIAQELKNTKYNNVIFIDETIDLNNLANQDLERLRGWLNIDEVAVCAPRIVARGSKVAADCGAMITPEGIKPIFFESVPYHQTPMGNIEWVRNLRLVSPLLFVAKPRVVLEALNSLSGITNDSYVYTALQLRISDKHRVVFDPKIYIELSNETPLDTRLYWDGANEALRNMLTGTSDPYYNCNLSADDPMNLAKIVQASEPDEELPELTDAYQNEALAHAMNISLTQQELNDNIVNIQKYASKPITADEFLFILPGFQAIYAGLNNIFSYADFLRSEGKKIHISMILEEKDLGKHVEIIRAKFPDLAKEAKFYAVTSHDTEKLPTVDVAICTQWATAYILAKFNRTKRKCYFIQDKEASFYPKGSISALVENTYKFGFFGLANTPGLLEWYKTEYEGIGVCVKSLVDLSFYYPDENKPTAPTKPYKVFFYARPNEPRNAFELGVGALVKLKKKYGEEIEIYAAGAEWNPVTYGLEGMVENLGKIAYDKLPKFYRSMDAGLMFMFSGHPGVVASELMASGCPVVVNQYDDATWNSLYINEETCMVAFPTADAVAEAIDLALTNTAIRAKVITGGRKKVTEFYKDYKLSCINSLKTLEKAV